MISLANFNPVITKNTYEVGNNKYSKPSTFKKGFYNRNINIYTVVLEQKFWKDSVNYPPNKCSYITNISILLMIHVPWTLGDVMNDLKFDDIALN
jgi:hypothetical protein